MRDADVVQLPVLPLPTPWTAFTAGHYGDEFVALHACDLPVREWMSGAVRSAGVGTGFSPSALARAAATNGGTPFSLTSLTEDYEVTMRLAGSGMRYTFAIEALFRPAEDRTGLPIDDAIAVRDFSPGRRAGRFGRRGAGSSAMRCRPGRSSAGARAGVFDTSSFVTARSCSDTSQPGWGS
jgi:hypothetical protein